MTKQAVVYGQTFNLYSEDGCLWCSDPALFPRIAERKQRIEAKNALLPWQRSMVVNWTGEEFYE